MHLSWLTYSPLKSSFLVQNLIICLYFEKGTCQASKNKDLFDFTFFICSAAFVVGNKSSLESYSFPASIASQWVCWDSELSWAINCINVLADLCSTRLVATAFFVFMKIQHQSKITTYYRDLFSIWWIRDNIPFVSVNWLTDLVFLSISRDFYIILWLWCCICLYLPWIYFWQHLLVTRICIFLDPTQGAPDNLFRGLKVGAKVSDKFRKSMEAFGNCTVRGSMPSASIDELETFFEDILPPSPRNSLKVAS